MYALVYTLISGSETVWSYDLELFPSSLGLVSPAALGKKYMWVFVRIQLNIWQPMLPTFVVAPAYLFRKILLRSSCVIGGFLELAAMRSGRRKLLTRTCSCCTYSASASSMLNTTWFRLRMLSAWGDRT